MGKNTKKLTYIEVKECVENLGYKLISKEYKNVNSKLIIKDKDGYYYTPFFNSLIIGNPPSKFYKSNPYTIQNIKLWCKINNRQFELISDTYEGNIKKLKWKCLKDECGEIFNNSWNDIINGHKCAVCAGRQVGLSNCLATKRPDLILEWNFELNKNLTPWDVTFSSGKYVWWKCKDCGHEWFANIDNRNSKNSGCPECRKSKGEKEIDRVLIENNWIKISQKDFDNLIDNDKYSKLYFIPQKEFEGLVGVGRKNLSYDYYIPKYNLLIEYQGEQHEKFIKGIHGNKKKFLRQLEHDRRKKEYTKINNINFIEIWYYDFDRIEEILNNYIIDNKYNFILGGEVV